MTMRLLLMLACVTLVGCGRDEAALPKCNDAMGLAAPLVGGTLLQYPRTYAVADSLCPATAEEWPPVGKASFCGTYYGQSTCPTAHDLDGMYCFCEPTSEDGAVAKCQCHDISDVCSCGGLNP